MSHQTDEDGKLAQAIASHVEAAGVRVWIAPRDISEGSFGQAIEQAIEDADVFAVVLGDHSPSGWVQMEINAALDLHISSGLRILPLFVSNDPQTPALLKGFHGIDFAESFDTGLHRLGEILGVADAIGVQSDLAAQQMDRLLAQVDQRIAEADRDIADIDRDLAAAGRALADREAALAMARQEVTELLAALEARRSELRSAERLFEERSSTVELLESEVDSERALVRTLSARRERRDRNDADHAGRLDEVVQARHRLRDAGPLRPPHDPDVLTVQSFCAATQSKSQVSNARRYRNRHMVQAIALTVVDAVATGEVADRLIRVCETAEGDVGLDSVLDLALEDSLGAFDGSLRNVLFDLARRHDAVDTLTEGLTSWMVAVERVSECYRTLRLAVIEKVLPPTDPTREPEREPEVVRSVELMVAGFTEGADLEAVMRQFRALLARYASSRPDYMTLRSRQDLSEPETFLVSEQAARDALDDAAFGLLALRIVIDDESGASTSVNN